MCQCFGKLGRYPALVVVLDGLASVLIWLGEHFPLGRTPVMKSQDTTPLSQQIPSHAAMVCLSCVLALAVLAAGLLLQWFVYDDWLHRTGPLQVTGSLLASLLTFAFAFRWQTLARDRKIRMLHRFETIAQMNDRIRNALQIIECATYATNPQATAPVRKAVDVIEGVLEEVLVEARPLGHAPPKGNGTPTSLEKGKSA